MEAKLSPIFKKTEVIYSSYIRVNNFFFGERLLGAKHSAVKQNFWSN